VDCKGEVVGVCGDDGRGSAIYEDREVGSDEGIEYGNMYNEKARYRIDF